MGEHSPCDALVPSIVFEYGVLQGVVSDSFSSSLDSDAIGWKRLNWEIDSYIEKEIQRVERETEELVGNSDDEGLWFADYGTDWIKNVGRYRLGAPLFIIPHLYSLVILINFP